VRASDRLTSTAVGIETECSKILPADRGTAPESGAARLGDSTPSRRTILRVKQTHVLHIVRDLDE
jgi:hypothetical protein